jgi:hypothetical protein
MYDIVKDIINSANENELTQTITIIILALFGLSFLVECLRIRKTSIKFKNTLEKFEFLADALTNGKALDEQKLAFKEQYFSKLKAQGTKFLLTSFPLEIANSPEPSRLRFMTGVLTTTGVIGTFLGIVVGLAGVKDKLNNNSAEMFEGVKNLLGGMDVAFVTSLVGLISSVLLIFTFKVTERYLRRKHESTLSRFNSRFRNETMADYLDKFAGGDQDKVIAMQLAAAKKSAEASEVMLSMGSSLEKAVNNFDADKIGQHLSTSLDKIFTQEMVPVFSEISVELKSLREIKQDNGEKIIQAIMGQLRTEVIEPLSQQISETSVLIQTSTDSVNKLHDGLGDVALKLSGAVSTLQTFQQETMAKLSDFSQDLRGILASFQGDTKVILEGVSAQLSDAVKASVEVMDEQKTAFKHSADQAANTFRGIRQELETALSNQAGIQKNMLDDTAGRVNDILTKSHETHDAQVTILAKVGETARDMLNNAVNASVTAMDEQKEAFKHSADQAANTFRGIRQDLETALSNQAGIQKNMLDDTAGRVNDILTKSHETHDLQVKTLIKVGETASGLMDNARESLSLTLANVDSVLIETKNTVTEQLDQFRVTYQGSLDTFFTQQNNLLENTLGKQRDGLAEVVDKFNSVFIEEYNRRKELNLDLDENVNSILEAVTTVNKMVDAVHMYESAHINQVEQSAKTIGLQVGQLQKSYQGSSDLFGELLTQIPDELNKYFDRANQSYEAFFSEMDKASAQIHNRLLQSAEYLISAESQRQMMNDEEVT